MSALERLEVIGDICGSLRLPSRDLKSCIGVNCAGWPASEGMAGSVEFPPGPWQTMQARAFCGTSSAAKAAQCEKKESAAANIAAALRLSFTSYRSSRGR